MKVWDFILQNLLNKIDVAVLYVIDSRGSSPGRKGFVMAVTENGKFTGTIGGGIMEVKLIELAKHNLLKGDRTPMIKEQYHDKERTRNQSGLICSGSQTVALIPLSEKDISIVEKIAYRTDRISVIIDSKKGLQHLVSENTDAPLGATSELSFIVQLDRPKTIHIFGAGHVGVALANQMSLLGYKIYLYDDRPELYTHQAIQLSIPIRCINYENLLEGLIFHPLDLVAIMTFSYRSDKILLKQLYNSSLAYIGMMGSDQKIKTLKEELAQEGISEEDIKHVFAPIGINMYSKTAQEIAVSIAGQIILESNKQLPTGRSY